LNVLSNDKKAESCLKGCVPKILLEKTIYLSWFESRTCGINQRVLPVPILREAQEKACPAATKHAFGDSVSKERSMLLCKTEIT
jgi:hypothetical protein